MDIRGFGGLSWMKCVSMSNQLCHARPTNFDINFNENSQINSNKN